MLMGLFNFGKANNSNANAVNSSEYERLSIRIADISSEVKSVKADHELLKTDIANLRGKFNQRLKGLKEEETKDEEKKIETIIKDEYIAFG